MPSDFDLESLIRPNILALSPYRSARDDYSEGILIDANENGFGDALDSEWELNRYPDPYQKKLREKISELKFHPQNGIFVGNGSDEAIDLLYRIFCTPGKDNVIICPPTYGMYKVSASIHDIEVRTAPLTAFCSLDIEAIKAQIDAHSKLLFICSPNNPTANLMDTQAIEELLELFTGIVVLDEAYIDFSPQQSWIQRISEFQNLIVLQTLSKAYGMAGIRLGMAFASEELTKWLMRVKAPYNLSKNTQELALKALSEQKKIKARVHEILNERLKMIAALERIPAVAKIWPTDANFVLIRIKNALRIYKQLADSGVIVRYRGNEIHCEDSLRISIGTPEENQAFLKALKAILR